MTILSKTDIVGLLGGIYPVLTADDCADLRETFYALHAALETWVVWIRFDFLEGLDEQESEQWQNAVALTKAAGIEIEEGEQDLEAVD